MAKVNYSKVENAFDNALRELFIERLSELASIAQLINDPESKMTPKMVDEIILRFQKELKKLKKQDAKLFRRLNLTPEDESRFSLSSSEYAQEDWHRLKALKERIDELKRELYGQDVMDVEYEKQVTKERRRHINKRFNIRDGWMPLH